MAPARNINRHAQLVRASVLAVKGLQQACDALASGPAFDACTLALTALDMALHGQRVTDEEVVVAVRDGVAVIKHKTDFVKVAVVHEEATYKLEGEYYGQNNDLGEGPDAGRNKSPRGETEK